MHPNSIIDELVGAARGFVALLTGNRSAPSHFDFSQAGLIGSFIALLVATALGAFGPGLLGTAVEAGLPTRSIIVGLLLVAIQFGISFLVLRQMGRLDGFVPYVVADNWVTLFLSIVTVALFSVVGPLDVTVLALGLVSIILKVNIARLIVTLAPMQIVILLVAQVAGQFAGVLLLAGLLPVAPPPAA